MQEIIEKRPRLNFEQNCPFLRNEKSKFNKSFRNGFIGIKNITLHVFTKEKYSKMCQKGWKCQFWHTAAAILDSSIFRRGHPGFQTFINFFFKNGIKRYQVTNLSGVHDDLKLCPKNNPLYSPPLIKIVSHVSATKSHLHFDHFFKCRYVFNFFFFFFFFVIVFRFLTSIRKKNRPYYFDFRLELRGITR